MKRKNENIEINNVNSFPQYRKNSLQVIKGIGPRRIEALNKAGIYSVEELLLYYPKSYIDVSSVSNLRELKKNLTFNFINKQSLSAIKIDQLLKSQQTVVAKVVSKVIRTIRFKKQLLTINIADGTSGTAKINFWNAVYFFNNLVKEGDLVAVTGKAEFDGFSVSFTHPEIMKIEEEEAGLYMQGRILSKYLIPEGFVKVGLSNNTLRRMIQLLLKEDTYHIPETLPEDLLKKLNIPDIKTALNFIHSPKNRQEVEIAQFRVKFEEVFYYELSLIKQRLLINTSDRGVVLDVKSKNARKVVDKLPFKLTQDQTKVINEIAKDLQSGKAMNRLLQGDVGSGKTIVATLIMLIAAENNFQALLIAPTEILAEQHYSGILKLVQGLDVLVVKLLGGMKVKEKRETLGKIKSGEAQIIIGTHALFQQTVEFHNLVLLVIDEQHRFGVEQRAKLSELAKESLNRKEQKAEFDNENIWEFTPHSLVMSATPIPRTLNLTYYGDLDISIIKTKPALRKNIITKIQFESQIEEVYTFIKNEVNLGRQAFIVYPLVEKSEKLEGVKSALEHYETLSYEVFPEFSIGLIHGQMSWAEKEEKMLDFYNKKFQILVATTVIEVGIDVPNASVIMIENSDRFGLSQLHQLRGRVGRGENQSYCFLITKDDFRIQVDGVQQGEQEKKNAIIRLKTMEDTNDGFQIAEVDIRLRGPGDILGVKQSGLPKFKYVDIVEDVEIVDLARQEALLILKQDANLTQEKNKMLNQNLENYNYLKNNYLDIA